MCYGVAVANYRERGARALEERLAAEMLASGGSAEELRRVGSDNV